MKTRRRRPTRRRPSIRLWRLQRSLYLYLDRFGLPRGLSFLDIGPPAPGDVDARHELVLSPPQRLCWDVEPLHYVEELHARVLRADWYDWSSAVLVHDRRPDPEREVGVPA